MASTHSDSGLSSGPGPLSGPRPQTDTGDSSSDPRIDAIIDAASEVHQELGSGLREAVYHKALALELSARGVPFRDEVVPTASYKGQELGVSHRAGFICFGEIATELKVLSRLTDLEEAQFIKHMETAGYETGLLLNFGAPSLEHKRFIVPSLDLGVRAKAEDFEHSGYYWWMGVE